MGVLNSTTREVLAEIDAGDAELGIERSQLLAGATPDIDDGAGLRTPGELARDGVHIRLVNDAGGRSVWVIFRPAARAIATGDEVPPTVNWVESNMTEINWAAGLSWSTYAAQAFKSQRRPVH